MDYRWLCKFPLCESFVKDFTGQIFTGIKSTFDQIWDDEWVTPLLNTGTLGPHEAEEMQL